MTRDRKDIEELAHDSSGIDAGPFMAEALDSIVEQLMAGEKVRGLAWGLQDFLGAQADVSELLSASISTGDRAAMLAEIERRLRAELEDADVTHDLAAEMASEPEEKS